MTSFSKYFSCVVLISFLSACNSGGGADRIIADNSDKVCVPEQDLYKNGIIGGETVQPNGADSKKVVLLYSSLGDSQASICTAALIAPDVLLTAAHCVRASASQTVAFFYSSLSCESGFNAKKFSGSVSDIVVHEAYQKTHDEDYSTGDMALVFLTQPAPSSYSIYKIANPDLITSSNRIYFYGYGQIGSEANGSGILRKTELDRQDFQVLTDKKKIKINQSNGRGICQGDSGGPDLVMMNGELQILAVNSYVDGPDNHSMCDGDAYSTLAYSYKSWIEQKMAARGRSLRK